MNKQELYEFMLSLNRSNFLDLTDEQKSYYDSFNEWFEQQFKSSVPSWVKDNMDIDDFNPYKSK